jgi:hypothetical protein
MLPHLARLAWQRTLAAFALNLVGMPLEIIMRRSVPGIPVWPSIVSMTISGTLLLILVQRRHRATVRLTSWMFLVHNVGIVSALWVTSGHFAVGSGSWIPLQANKLGAVIVAAVAPEARFAGSISIAMFVVAAFARAWTLRTVPVLAPLFGLEVATIFVFGLFASLLLLHRSRSDRLRDGLVDAQSKSQALSNLAHRLLAISDLANTPLQILELNVPLLATDGSEESIVRIERAISTLRSWHRILDREAMLLNWSEEWESFDAQTTLREGFDPARRLREIPSDEGSPPANGEGSDGAV